MKKIFGFFASGMMFGALALTGCAKNTAEAPAANNGDGNKVPVIITTKSDDGLTRTSASFDGTTYRVSWTQATDQLGVFGSQNGDGAGTYSLGSNAQFSIVSVTGGIATFTGSLSAGSGAPYNYYAYYPYAATVGADPSALALTLPATQSPTQTSFDGTADILLGTPVSTTSAAVGYLDNGDPLNFVFSRPVAVASFGVKSGSVPSVISATDYVQSVTLDFGAPVAGDVVANITAANPTLTLGATTSNTITLNYTGDNVPLDNNFKIWWTMFPATATSMTITISTGLYDVVKTVPSSITFNAGNIALATLDLGLNTTAKMYESGTGVSGDPYMVKNMKQLHATITTYGSAYISLMNDIPTANWATLTTFAGTLDGAGYKITGLTAPFVATNTGTIKNVAFTGVNIATTASGNIGVVANSSSGTYDKVAVTGTLTRTTTTGNQPTGGIIGDMTGGGVNNSYVDLTMGVAGNYAGGIVGLCDNTTGAKTITKCTTAGTLTASVGTAFGGILGRIINTSGAVTISNCSSSMVITATASGSTMVGGIFGACQPSGTNTYKIDQCQFTGRVDAFATGGGISGVGCRISNCIVIGAGTASTTNPTVRSGADSSNPPGGGINASVKDNISNCIVVNARFAANNGTNPFTVNSAARNTSGICVAQNANTPTVTGCVLLNSSLADNARTIIGFNASPLSGFGTVSNNFYSGVTYFSTTAAYTPVGDASIDGTDAVVAGITMDQAWYTTIGYDFTTPIWQLTAGYPTLVNVGCDAAVIPAP